MSKTTIEKKDDKKETCGIIMPISEIDGCTAEHWLEVRTILNEAIENAGFEGNIVSDADESGVIQKRIIQNLYDNPIVVCDVSARNPNVLFELGMRLAFDKPTVIIKDDKTNYIFDTSMIEHIPYRRDLNYTSVVKFKELLTKKIIETYKASKNADYSTFLKHLGPFKVAKIETTSVPEIDLLRDDIKSLKEMVFRRTFSTPESPMFEPASLAKKIPSPLKHYFDLYIGLKIDTPRPDLQTLMNIIPEILSIIQFRVTIDGQYYLFRISRRVTVEDAYSILAQHYKKELIYLGVNPPN